jgi:hypothetical protein
MADATKSRGLFGAVLAVVPAIAWAQLPAGIEFQANTYTTSLQLNPSAAMDARGAFVIVWQSQGQDGDNTGVFGQRFDAAGTPQGPEFQVNTETRLTQQTPAVAADAEGRFVVVWRSRDQDGDIYGIFGQRYDVAGAPAGSEFQINSYTTGSQLQPAVTAAAGGNFVVVWAGNLGGDYEIFGQRYDAAGVPRGAEFRINSYVTGLQLSPAVTSDAAGNVVVVWTSGQDGDGGGIFGRRFDAAGAPVGSDFLVNAYTFDTQSQPSVASDRNGDFVVVWQSPDVDGTGIFGRRFAADGTPLGGDFQVNSYSTSDQTNPVVASDASGSLVVAWMSRGQDGSGYAIAGQRFSAAGLADGSEFQVNAYTTGYQSQPVIATSPFGNFVVAWHGNYPDTSYGIRGQVYGDVIFKDGFES